MVLPVIFETLVAKLPELLKNLDKILHAVGKAVDWLGKKLKQGLQWAGDKLKAAFLWIKSLVSGRTAPDVKLRVPESRVIPNAEERLQTALDRVAASIFITILYIIYYILYILNPK